MYIKIHGTKDYVKGNTQSCRDLINYLEKENEDKDLLAQEQFFNQTSNSINSEFAINAIDTNKKGLKEKEAKFFMMTVNPSERELKHLAQLATNGKVITNISEMNPEQLEKYNNLIKSYAREVMDDYAKAFDRGIDGGDLVYFGKLEHERHFKGTDKNVLEGTATSGELKKGLQCHVHIVVSRKDKTQKLSLSPLANSKGSSKKHQLNGKSVKVGFNRDEFANTCEKEFDRMYGYNRDFQNTYSYYKFRTNPTYTVGQSVRLSSQLVLNQEQAAKNLTIQSIDKLTNTKVASGLNTASSLLQNPETAKDLLVGKLENMINNLLPPEVRAAKKVAETVLKPIIELGTGL